MVSNCNRCGFCNAVCPVYQATGIESMGPRGRNIIASAAEAGEIERNKSFNDSVMHCLLCKACETACYPGISTDEIMLSERTLGLNMQSGLLKTFFRQVLPYNNRLSGIMKLVAAGKNSGGADLLEKIGLPGRVWPYFKHANQLANKLPGRFLREVLSGQKFIPTGKSKGKVGYFIGCGINYMMPDTGISSIRLIRSTGYEVVPLENNCCGLVSHTYGDIDASAIMAQKNARLMKEVDLVVTDCASCASFLSTYDNFGLNVDKSPVVDISAFLSENRLIAHQGFGNEPVTYHDPCHLGRYMGITKEPRRLIEQVATLVEMEDAGGCCGGAGTYSIRENEVSTIISDKKAAAIAATGAKKVVTVCPACIVQIRAALARNNMNDIEVIHLSNLLES